MSWSCCRRSGGVPPISTPWRSASQAPVTAAFGRSRAASEEAAARSPGSICTTVRRMSRRSSSRRTTVLLSWSATPSATGSRACSRPIARSWYAPSRWWRPISARRRVRRGCAAIRASADPSLPAKERIEALQFAFFAPGNDPRPWLEGWYPEVLAAQRIAGDRTSREEDFGAGESPILYLQPDHDPLAHVEDAEAYARLFDARVTVVVIHRASHAVIAEQPEAVIAALIAYARGLWPR